MTTNYYPAPVPAPGLKPLTGDALNRASADYWRLRAMCYERQPLAATDHILWLLVTMFTFGLGIIPWMIKAGKGRQVLRPGALLPPWPPPGYYIPAGQ